MSDLTFALLAIAFLLLLAGIKIKLITWLAKHSENKDKGDE